MNTDMISVHVQNRSVGQVDPQRWGMNTDMSVSLAPPQTRLVHARDTDMSAFMGLSPNNDLKNGLTRASQCSWPGGGGHEL